MASPHSVVTEAQKKKKEKKDLYTNIVSFSSLSLSLVSVANKIHNQVPIKS